MVFRESPVRRVISRTDNWSRNRIRLIFANIPMVITPTFLCSNNEQSSADTWVSFRWKLHPEVGQFWMVLNRLSATEHQMKRPDKFEQDMLKAYDSGIM